MGRMKLAALLQHSKKKGRARLNAVTIVVVGVVVMLLVMSLVALRRYKSEGNIDGNANHVNVGVVEGKVADEYSDDKEGLDGSIFSREAIYYLGAFVVKQTSFTGEFRHTQ